MAVENRGRDKLGTYEPTNYDYQGEPGARSLNPPHLKNNEAHTKMLDQVAAETSAAATLYGYKNLGGAL